jgi:hypothetical protein
MNKFQLNLLAKLTRETTASLSQEMTILHPGLGWQPWVTLRTLAGFTNVADRS